MKKFIPILIAVVVFGCSTTSVLAQDNASVLYVPLIGITSVPEPLALPKGAGDVTYRYAVKNFLREAALTGVQVTDDKCSPAKFIEGDDNGDGKLDYSETWRYTCTTKLSVTTQSIATAIGTANNLPAAHKAYATVVVGSDNAAPLVNIINITKVAYPLTLPVGGGNITFTYRVNNPGVVPLSDVSVTDDKCSAMSSRLGDINGNQLLDITEVWVYTCTTHLTQTTTNTVSVAATANGLQAVGYATITVTVAIPTPESSPSLPEVEGALEPVPSFPDQQPESVPAFPETGENSNVKTMVWAFLSGILAALIVFLVLTRKNKSGKAQKKSKSLLQLVVFVVLSAGVVGAGYYFLLVPQLNQDTVTDSVVDTVVDELFGWKYPVVRFPTTGPGGLAYSDIRDPGGIPQGLPVRLKIPGIGVDSAIEDALITPDGRMDVPAGSRNVAWFALGPHPGQEGSAVIGGHFGIQNGVPFVFYDLDKLVVGDKIYIEDDKGDTLAFQVRSIKLFNRNADATTVFTSDDGIAHLNIITCEGIWNRVNDTYPERRVVFTDRVTADGAVPSITPMSQKGSTKAEDIAAFPRTFGVGASGADVVALQTFLEEKGFLTMPQGVSKGFFGRVTGAAVAKYQTSAGLEPAGVFGPLTRAKVLAELGGDTGLPNAGNDSVPETPVREEEIETPSDVENQPTIPQILIQSVRSLFASPLDALITILLLIAIALIAFKIIRR